MDRGRTWRTLFVATVGAATLTAACGRRPAAEVEPIEPSISFNRTRVPLGSAVEVEYTWKLGAAAKKIDKDFRVMVHFLDKNEERLFQDDHLPEPTTTAWEAGQTYSYKRTVFVPIYPYVGDVEVRVGLYAASGRGERLALQGEDKGLSEIKVAGIEFLPQTENIFVVEKEGWHSPETSRESPAVEHTWTRKEAVLSFKNPKKDVIFYLEADTNFKAFEAPPRLTISLDGRNTGLEVPIESSALFLKRLRFTAEQLGDGDWIDLRLAMNQSFVPSDLGLNPDDRELGLLVYHYFVGTQEELGDVPDVVDAGELPDKGNQES